MSGKERDSDRSLKSDLNRIDSHVIQPDEYHEIPELTDEQLVRARVNRGGRPPSKNPRKLLSLRLPADVIERWRESGPGWQTRMADLLSQRAPRA
jgi:uncharacterized protein (DUF4415 family)